MHRSRDCRTRAAAKRYAAAGIDVCAEPVAAYRQQRRGDDHGGAIRDGSGRAHITADDCGGRAGCGLEPRHRGARAAGRRIPGDADQRQWQRRRLVGFVARCRSGGARDAPSVGRRNLAGQRGGVCGRARRGGACTQWTQTAVWRTGRACSRVADPCATRAQTVKHIHAGRHTRRSR